MDEKSQHGIESAHAEDISKDVPHPTMTGFDTTEEDLPPGYFTSSFFIGTMYDIPDPFHHAGSRLTLQTG